MTIQSAIKKNKEMRRKSWPEGQWVVVQGNTLWTGVWGMIQYCPTRDDILATDWMVHA